MKKGWKTVEIGQIAELRGRIGWKGLTAKEYTNGGPLFLSVHSLNYGDYVDYRDAFHISQERYDESPEIMLARNDILICKDGAGIGKVGLVGEVTEPATINSSLLLIRPSVHVIPKYLYFCLKSPYFQEIVQSRLEGATTPHLYQRDITTFPVVLPAMEEQQTIAAILDEAFEGLDRARAHAEANLQNARELFEASLRQLISESSEHWPKRTLMEVCTDFGRGRSKHRPRNDPALYGGPIPFIQTGEVSEADHFITEFRQTYSEIGLSQSKLWPSGTVCVAIVGATIGESGILEFDACFPDSVIGMTVNCEEADPEYIEYLLQFFKAELKNAGKGSARDNINIATFADRLFPIPDVETQRIIAGRLNQLSKELRLVVSRYLSKLHDLDDLRQSLLHKAFEGELTQISEPAYAA